MAPNFPNLVNNNLTNLKVQKTPSRLSMKKILARQIIIKLLKAKNKNLKVAREKDKLHIGKHK